MIAPPEKQELVVESECQGYFIFGIDNEGNVNSRHSTYLDQPEDAMKTPLPEFLGYLKNAWELAIKHESATDLVPVEGIHYRAPQLNEITEYIFSHTDRDDVSNTLLRTASDLMVLVVENQGKRADELEEICNNTLSGMYES